MDVLTLTDHEESSHRRIDYVIVEFPEETKNGIISMALISSEWIFESDGMTYCHWPTYLKTTLSREKAVRLHTLLNVKKCDQCPIIIKHHDENYERASAKLRQLEAETDIEHEDSNSEPFPHQKSKSQKCKDDFVYYRDSDTDDNIDYIPTPPKFPYNKIKTKKVDESKDNFNLREVTVSNSITQNRDELCSSQNLVTQLSTDHLQRTSTENDVQSRQLRETSLLSQSEKHCGCEKNSKIQERILRDLQIIKIDIKTLIQLNNTGKISDFETLDDQLNFSKYEELIEFDGKLIDETYFNKMLSGLSLLGGREVNDTVKKICSLIISHELALNLNWIGANDKGSFQKLGKLLKLIFAAVRRNSHCSNSTNTEIERAIRNWLKNAPDRAGGRTQRKGNK